LTVPVKPISAAGPESATSPTIGTVALALAAGLNAIPPSRPFFLVTVNASVSTGLPGRGSRAVSASLRDSDPPSPAVASPPKSLPEKDAS